MRLPLRQLNRAVMLQVSPFCRAMMATRRDGGSPVGLYTPNPIGEGSSISHLDDDNPAFAGSMMLQATDEGPSARTFSNIELAILRDLGYTQISQIVPIPEPATAMLALLGFAVFVSACRRNARR